MINTKVMLVKLAAYYEKTLTDDQIEIYSEQLFEHLTNQELSIACKKYIENAANEFFPRPVSKLIALIKKPIDENDQAVQAASLVLEAVSRFGWPNEAEAMDFIGPLGKMAVKRFCGWIYVCENLGNELSLTTFQAQCRDMIKSDIKIGHIKQGFPQIEQKSVLKVLDFKIKEIEK